MREQQLRALERQALDEPGALEALARELARHGRSLLDPLASLDAWRVASRSEQDLAITLVAARLKPAFRLAESDVGARACRIAAFACERSGAILHLLPGQAERPPFLMGRGPITNAELARGRGLKDPPRGREPAVNLGFKETEAWLRRLGLRLPTREEWEFAQAAGTQTRFSWGDEFDPEEVWHSENLRDDPTRTRGPQPIAGHAERANPFGLIDMVGNVFEWIGGTEGISNLGGCFASAATEFEAGIPRGSWLRSGEGASIIGMRAALSIPEARGAEREGEGERE